MSSENKHKERLIELRAQLRKAMEFENQHETWSDIMTKLLNTAHNVSMKAEHEASRLKSLMDSQLGTKDTADMLADIIVNTLSAHNRQEEARKASQELKEQGLDGPSSGDLEVEQREREAEEKAKAEELKEEKVENTPPKEVKAIPKTTTTKKANRVVRRRK